MDLQRYWFVRLQLWPGKHYSKILRELNTYTLNEKILRSRPWVLANPGPHDEEDAGPDQGELDEEGVEVGRRLRHNVAHQVNSPASEVVKLVWRGHLYIQDLIDMLQKLQNHAL